MTVSYTKRVHQGWKGLGQVGAVGLPLMVLVFLILIVTLLTGKLATDLALFETVNAHDNFRQRSVERQALRQIVKESFLGVLEPSQTYTPANFADPAAVLTLAIEGGDRQFENAQNGIETVTYSGLNDRLMALNGISGGVNLALVAGDEGITIAGGEGELPVLRFFPNAVSYDGESLDNLASLEANAMENYIFPNGEDQSGGFVGGAAIQFLGGKNVNVHDEVVSVNYTREGGGGLEPIRIRFVDVPITEFELVAYSLPATNPEGELANSNNQNGNTANLRYLKSDVSEDTGEQNLPAFAMNLVGQPVDSVVLSGFSSNGEVDGTAKMKDSGGDEVLLLADEGIVSGDALPFRYRDLLSATGNLYEHIFFGANATKGAGGDAQAFNPGEAGSIVSGGSSFGWIESFVAKGAVAAANGYAPRAPGDADYGANDVVYIDLRDPDVFLDEALFENTLEDAPNPPFGGVTFQGASRELVAYLIEEISYREVDTENENTPLYSEEDLKDYTYLLDKAEEYNPSARPDLGYPFVFSEALEARFKEDAGRYAPLLEANPTLTIDVANLVFNAGFGDGQPFGGIVIDVSNGIPGLVADSLTVSLVDSNGTVNNAVAVYCRYPSVAAPTDPAVGAPLDPANFQFETGGNIFRPTLVYMGGRDNRFVMRGNIFTGAIFLGPSTIIEPQTGGNLTINGHISYYVHDGFNGTGITLSPLESAEAQALGRIAPRFMHVSAF